MKVIVIQRMVVEVPELLQEEMRKAFDDEDHQAIDEMVGDIDFRFGFDELLTMSAEIEGQEPKKQLTWKIPER